MAADRLSAWESLFKHALSIIDEATGLPESGWSFGGGTVLMRRYRHRVSRDVDIFVPDPQWLGYLTPRLNAQAESLVSDYVEQATFLKLYFNEGEIDFVVSQSLSANPTIDETIFGRRIRVETSAEIIAKKIWHRGAEFTARDLFDFALVAEREPEALRNIAAIVEKRRDLLLSRLATQDAAIREDFEALEVLDFAPTYNACAAALRRFLN
jgi:predicted nucleotidyltransferase component of viral defense system